MYYEPAQKQWLFITDVFTPEECDEISAYSDMLESKKTLRVDKNKQQVQSNTIALMPENAKSRWIYHRLVHTLELTNPNTFQFDGLAIGEPVQVSTCVEKDFYNWHIDSSDFPSSPPVRKVSCFVLLNDSAEFEGGDLQVRVWNEETIKLTQGQGLFFASFLQHRVLPITEGVCKSMLIWYNGPSFK